MEDQAKPRRVVKFSSSNLTQKSHSSSYSQHSRDEVNTAPASPNTTHSRTMPPRSKSSKDDQEKAQSQSMDFSKSSKSSTREPLSFKAFPGSTAREPSSSKAFPISIAREPSSSKAFPTSIAREPSSSKAFPTSIAREPSSSKAFPGSIAREPSSIKGFISIARESSSTKNVNAGITPSSPKFERELEKKYKTLNYFSIADELRVQVPPRKNNYRLKTYQDTMVGSEITRWLASSKHALNTTEANYIASELLGKGLIYNVLNEAEEEFAGGNQLYKFSADDRLVFNVDTVDLSKVELVLTNVVKKREMMVKYTLYKDVFSGADAVTVLVQKGLVLQRPDAIGICERMIKLRIMTAVQTWNDKSEFADDNQSFYTLRDQKPNPIENAAISSLKAEAGVTSSISLESLDIGSSVSKDDSEYSLLTNDVEESADDFFSFAGPRSIFRIINNSNAGSGNNNNKPQPTTSISPSKRMISIKALLMQSPKSTASESSTAQGKAAAAANSTSSTKESLSESLSENQENESSKAPSREPSIKRQGSFLLGLRKMSGEVSSSNQGGHRDLIRTATSTKKYKGLTRGSSSRPDLAGEPRSKSAIASDSRIDVQAPDLESYYADLLAQNLVLDQPSVSNP